jgi:hypothetical protein
MKVIFLDIDGVLVTRDCLKTFKDGFMSFNPNSVAVLNKIVSETGAELVLSSCWRMHGMKGFNAHAKRQGVIKPVIAFTPRKDGERGDEIQEWLKTTEANVESFVIIDDDSDMGSLLPFLVRTDMEHGLTEQHHGKVLEILNK